MSVDKMPVFENFPAEKEQNKLVLWIKNSIYTIASIRINFLLSLLNSGFSEIPADDVAPGAAGNWRWRHDGTDLVLQLNVAGTWTDTAIKLLADGTVMLGDVDGTDFTKIEADGTVVFNGKAKVWNDIQFSLSTAKVPAVNAPSWDNFGANTNKFTFSVNDLVDLEANEVFHSYWEGSDIHSHVHFYSNGVDGTDRTVKFQLDIGITNPGAAYSEITVSHQFTIPANTPDKTHFAADIAILDGTAIEQAADITVRFTRIVEDSGTAPTSDPFVSMIGLHIEEDTVGSREEEIK